MSDILIKAGSTTPALRLESASPWSIRFTGVDDILMPFDGAIVLPNAAGTVPDLSLIGHHEWIFISLRYPQSGPANTRKFACLRDMRNRPVTTNKSAMILVASDHSLFDDIHPSHLFSDIKETYTPVYKNNYTICTLAKYFLIEFDESIFNAGNPLPVEVAPFSCTKDFSLLKNTSSDPGIATLKQALEDASSLNGTIRAFDLSGRETETYSSLRYLGIPKTDIDGAPSDADEKNIKVQFVDIHGEVMHKTVFPLEFIDYNPVPAILAGFEDPPFYQLAFTGADRKIKFTLQSEGTSPHLYHFHHFALWPGYGFQLKEISSSTISTDLDLIKDIETADLKGQTFARICVFHPFIEFQTDVGGDLVDRSYTNLEGDQVVRYKFNNNQLYAFTPYNKVSIFNCGADFFKDYHALVSVLKEKDRLYQANWSSHPFVHLKGSSSLRRIESNNLDRDSIDAQLLHSRDEFLLLPVLLQSKGMTSPQWRAIYLPSKLNGNEVFSKPLTVEVWTIPEPGEFTSLSKRTIVRPSSLFAWVLKLDDPEIIPSNVNDIKAHRLLVYWKNELGLAHSTSLEDLIQVPVQAVFNPAIDFPSGSIAIETDLLDPPQLQIRRLSSMSVISSEGDNVCLLVINLAAGTSCILPLNPPGADATSSNVIITEGSVYAEGTKERNAIDLLIKTFSAEDEFILAICHPPVGEDDLLVDLLISRLGFWAFDEDAIRTGDVPMHVEEIGGLFRQAISHKVQVRALYWEQYLALFSGGPNLSRGLNNNESISNIINRSIGGEHGFALRDRSTRDFGSWHQKSSVIIQKDPDDVIIAEDKLDLLISYLGGIDLGMGRWDTQLHFRNDPDRQAGMWYDVHVKIEGEAGFDVLRNFAHRWKANAVFLQSGFEKFRSVNVSTELTTELEAEFVMPEIAEVKFPKADESNAFVQITRTIPPRSCLSLPGVNSTTGVTIPELEGELGSQASYVKAIESARKFIVINEQYFFSQEIPLLLHQRLAAADGPDFVIIVLPIKLDESEFIDPNLFQMRKLAIDTLYFGADTMTPPADGSRCGTIIPNPTGDTSVKNKVAIMTPVNAEGDAVYVHSKHLIVDDVWMSIGSANLGNRSLTFDGEINAAIVGNSIYKGRMALVANHRIELCRQLLGLPDAYSALLQDPYAMFRLFKEIEAQQESYSLRLHPHAVHTKWLDPLYKLKVGEAAFDANVDAVAVLNFNDPSFSFLACNALDPDGRSNRPTRLAFLAGLGGIGKTVPSATADIGFSFSVAANVSIRAAILGGNLLRMFVKMAIASDSEDGPVLAGPFDLADFPLIISSTTNNIVLDGQPSNTISFPISVTDEFTAILEVIDVTVLPGTLLFSGEESFDPATASPPITHGSVRNAVVPIV